VFGRYRLIEVIGQGGMGKVYRAHDTMMRRNVAIKVLPSELATQPGYRERFQREAHIVAGLTEPHIIPIHEAGEIEGRLYLTMPVIDGVDLHTLLRRDGQVTPQLAVKMVEQLAAALDAAHAAGLVHRDVKPSNALLAANEFVYLIDFGIAHDSASTRLTSTGTTLGTWAYMAPECFTKGGKADARADVYSLACVLHECLTGQLPFPSDSLPQQMLAHLYEDPPLPSAQRGDIPAGFDEVMVRGLAKNPDQRYQTAGELAAAARDAVTDNTPSHPRSTAPTPALDPADNRRTAPTLITDAPPATGRTVEETTRPGLVPPPPPGQPPLQPSPPAAAPTVRRRVSRPSVVIAALVVVALLIVGGVFAGVKLFQHHNPAATAPSATAAATAHPFSGTYRADYSPGTDLEGKPVAGAPALTATWGVRTTCGPSGCVATASYGGGGGIVLVSNLVFDEVGGTWVAVGLSSMQCNNAPVEVWVVFTLQPNPDGTLSGETTRATSNSCSATKRTVTFTRTGDADVTKVPDPASLPPRAVSPAQALHGRYHEALTYANGNSSPGQDDLTVRTDCLRAGDRCMSLFHAPDGVVPLVFGSGKWTREDEGTVPCQSGGTTHIKITAEFPLPEPLQDPIPVLTGHGQNVSTGSACVGGDFEDKFVRTGD